MQQRREDLGGYLPARRQKSASLEIPDLKTFRYLTKGNYGRSRNINDDGLCQNIEHTGKG